MRQAEIVRKTGETDVRIELELDGKGDCDIDTGIGFLDHMLELFARHGRFGLRVVCKGDTRVDDHHSAEDIGIALGQAFDRALALNARCTLHIRQLDGRNSHHIIEGAFKSVARSLRAAVKVDPECAEEIPSTKGVL